MKKNKPKLSMNNKIANDKKEILEFVAHQYDEKYFHSINEAKRALKQFEISEIELKKHNKWLQGSKIAQLLMLETKAHLLLCAHETEKALNVCLLAIKVTESVEVDSIEDKKSVADSKFMFLYWIAECLLELGQKDEAITYYKMVIDYPDYDEEI